MMPMRLQLKSIGILIALWFLIRIVFFEGLWGFDDLHHVNFALNPNAFPQNHWQARLLFNSLIGLSIRVFGFGEWVLAIPGMLGSLAFVVATWWTGRQLWDDYTGFLAGILSCLLVLDVTHATYPAANSLANGFCAVGTGMVLAANKRRSFLVVGGLILGLSVLTHMTMVFYVAIFAVALIISTCPQFEWQHGSIFIASAVVCFLVLNLSTYALLTGDALYQFSIAAKTHLSNQSFAVPLKLPSGGVNPAWVRWPFINFIFSKAFGLLISLPVILAMLKWSRLEQSLRLVTLTIIIYWAYVCFGSQHPLHYLPLDHDTRYWYPLALPACILTSGIVRHYFKTKRLRFGLLAALSALNVFLLLSSGSWGQNVEISKELLHFANKHPETFFVTDRHTYTEMFILRGGYPPQNVGLLIGTKASFNNPDASFYRPPNDPKLKVLYNPLQEWRQHISSYLNVVANFERHEITPKRYRTIAYFLPKIVRNRYPQLVRKPAAQLLIPVAPQALK